jgi:ABC-type uncharacterized transport system substrate-binding protein
MVYAMRKAGVLSILFLLVLLAVAVIAEAQQPKKLPRIGYLAADPQGPTREAFRQGLRDLGYVEGQSILIEWRFAGDKPDRFPELAAELVHLKLDVIVAANSVAVAALKRATTTIPIVMATYSGDPVADDTVAGIARPGGNITGLIPLDPDLSGKQLEILKETIPKLSRLAVMWNPDDSGSRLQWQETQAAAGAIGIQPISLEVRALMDLDKAIEGGTRARV